ncbi:MAG: rhomboid family intramembrane serine protease [Planctomicrobium sp.]|jgi:membrane associated rhomboid family serine protease|nr:rhomboid family intramembrane serine protease [Planctomicrobium sp.]
MGLDNRDYMRDESATYSHHRGGGGSAMENIVKTLIIVNVIVFLMQVFIKVPISLSDFSDFYVTDGFTDEEIAQGYEELRSSGRLREIPLVNKWFMLDSEKVFQGQIWRLTTYDFLHSTDSIFHLLFNMWLLFLAGRAVADKYGQKEFLWFYLLAGIFSAAFYILWGLINGESVAAVGASGAVSAILVLYAMNWPYQKWYIYGIIPLPVIVLVLISAGMDIFPMLQQLSGSKRGDNIAHSAHIGGMLFGFLYYKLNWRLTQLIPEKFSLSQYLRFKRKPKLKIHKPTQQAAPTVETAEPRSRQPIPPEIAQRVDELLEKISHSGEASLTTEERDFLHESSRKYR